MIFVGKYKWQIALDTFAELFLIAQTYPTAAFLYMMEYAEAFKINSRIINNLSLAPTFGETITANAEWLEVV